MVSARHPSGYLPGSPHPISAKIPTTDIADLLGIRKSKKGNYHCFNGKNHNNDDRNPSLSISGNGNGFNCFACGVKGNNVELVKMVLNIDENRAFKWLEENFPDYIINSKHSNHLESKKTLHAEMSFHIRLIQKGLENIHSS